MAEQVRVDAIQEYLKMYSSQFPEQSLNEQLKNAGYTDEEINLAKQQNPIDSSQPIQPVQPVVPQETVQNQPIADQFVQPSASYQSQQPMIGSDFPSSSGSNNKVIIIAVAIIGFIIAGVVGYGFWNGSQVKSYAEKAKGYMETAKKWDALSSSSVSESGDVVGKDSDKILVELKKKAPGKASKLESKLKEYFNFSKELSEMTRVFALYMEESEKVSKVGTDLGSLDIAVGDNVGAGAAFDSAKDDVLASVKRLEENKVPEKLKNLNEKIIKIFKDSANALGDAADAVRVGDSSGVQDAISSLRDASQEGYSLDSDIQDIYGNPNEKFDSLEKEIQEEIDAIKNTSFSF